MVNNHNIEDYVGKRFGHLTVIGLALKTHELSNRFVFLCDCGNTIEEQPTRVISGHKLSCGKCRYAHSHPYSTEKFKEYIGQKSGKLTAIDVVLSDGDTGSCRILCQCECGNTHILTPYQFNRKIVKSCGCGKGKPKTIPTNNSKLYAMWKQMLSRCENPKNKWYHRYGGRGIKVCAEWHNYLEFEEWVSSTGGKPEKCSLDRIDNDGDYCPENYRWATQKQQVRNCSRNIMLTYNGKTQCLADWAEETGLSWASLAHRYHRGWDIERMLTTPMQTHKKQN